MKVNESESSMSDVCLFTQWWAASRSFGKIIPELTRPVASDLRDRKLNLTSMLQRVAVQPFNIQKLGLVWMFDRCDIFTLSLHLTCFEIF